MSAAIVQRKDLGSPCRGRGFESRWPLHCRSGKQQLFDNRIAVTVKMRATASGHAGRRPSGRDQPSRPRRGRPSILSRSWLMGEQRPFKPRGAGSIPAERTRERGATDKRSGLLIRRLWVQIPALPPLSRDRGRAVRHRPPKADTRVRLPPVAPSRGRRPVAGREPSKLETRVRIPSPAPSGGASSNGKTPDLDSVDLGSTPSAPSIFTAGSSNRQDAWL